jgi:hypothetical protein
MSCRVLLAALALAAAAWMMLADARAFDESKYPEWYGQWTRPRSVGNQWDPTKPGGPAQQAPLTPEYQAIYEANLADQKEGGQGTDPLFRCLPPGMPRQMTVVFPMEIIIMPGTTYMAFEQGNVFRRIYTDGRDWPKEQEPSFAGYSIGKWSDSDGDGRYDLLEVETRGFRGPRAYEPSGIPLHADNRTIIKERFYGDKADKGILYDEITTIDNALTRPWTVLKTLIRSRNPMWYENNCQEGNNHVLIGKDNYVMSADGRLMPTRKNQAPPDLSYFETSKK